MKFCARIVMRRNGIDLFDRNRFQVGVMEGIEVPFLRWVHLSIFTFIRFLHIRSTLSALFFFRREGFPDYRSRYIQTVEISLEDLFSGVAEKKFTVKDSFVESLKCTKQHFGTRQANELHCNHSPFNVVCTLKEKHHDNFQQVGDQLHAVISVPTMKAKRGCPIAISFLDSDTSIEVFVELEEVRKSGTLFSAEFCGYPSQHSACEAKVATYRPCCSC